MTGKKTTTASLARIPGVVNGANGNDHRSNKPVVTNVPSQLIQKHFCSISSQAFSGIEFNARVCTTTAGDKFCQNTTIFSSLRQVFQNSWVQGCFEPLILK
jgi:hypothetical protein